MVKDLFDIKGKKAIVTGASKGLGYAMAEVLLESGCEVVLIGSSNKVYDASKEFNDKGYKSYAVQANLIDREENYKAFEKSMEFLNNDIDILVTAAGIQRRYNPEDFPINEWDNVININLNSVFIFCQLSGNIMLKKGKGKIINVASMISFFGGQTIAAYAASKGAVAQLTKALSNDWLSKGINVNAIAPGYMSTDMNEGILNNPERYSQISSRIPAGRWGTPDDMKGITVFLSSDASNYISGAIIPVDGGYLVK